MWVKNIDEESDQTCPCGSWLKHWEKGSNSNVVYCGTKMCMKNTKLGGHVLKAESPDRGEYIVPLCPECNKRSDPFEVAVPLVPAGEQAFCRATGAIHRDMRALREKERILSSL